MLLNPPLHEAGLDTPFALMVEAELIRLGAVVKRLEVADRLVTRAAKEPARGRWPEAPAPGGGQVMNLLQRH